VTRVPALTNRRGPAFWIGLTLVVGLFALPLFARLDEPELSNDEAIYSYAVDRILDTGHWLTPRAITTDASFLEKPPLKFWITAGAMRAGVLPRSDAGMRGVDALFGAVAFVYVYLIGYRLAGPMCGVVAALVLFTFGSLVFEHGLRSNNMEAAVFLCYCGGIFHFTRWMDVPTGRASRRHAIALAACFVLGFMTKFVAALFLPLVCALALVWRPDGRAALRARGRDLALAAGIVLAATAPWFVYESWQFGAAFWRTIFGVHVFQRFTTGVDAAHLQPWSYYLTATWEQARLAGSALLIVAGLARLAVAGLRGESWLARVVLLWAVVPMAAISMGTSKLVHYAFPFWPPIALGAGLVFAWALQTARHVSARPVGRRVRATVLTLALVMLAIGLWTVVVGPIRIDAGGAALYQNSSFLRPALVALVLAWLASQPRTLAELGVAFVLALLLPLHGYLDRIHRIGEVEHPVRAARDCINRVEQDGALGDRGVVDVAGEAHDNRYFYYLGRTGPWVTVPPAIDSVAPYITEPARQAPILVGRAGYASLVATLVSSPAARAAEDTVRDALTSGAVAFDVNLGVLLPGAFRSCAAPILAAGGQAIWAHGASGRDR